MARFTCPNCQALYHIVKVEAGADGAFHYLTCRACGLARFPGRDREFVVKYFLLRHGARRRLRRRVHDPDPA